MLAGRPAAAVPAGAFAALALLPALGGGRAGVCVAVAVLVPAGAWIGAGRLAAIDRSPLSALAGRDVILRGYVVRRERTSFGVRRFRVRVHAVLTGDGGGSRGDPAELVQVRVPRHLRLARPAVGDELVAAGSLQLPRKRPGADFDYAAYLRRAGVHTVLRAGAVRLSGRRRGGPAGAVDSLRRRAEAGVSAGLSPSLGALARGMVLGEDEDVPAPMSDDFKRSGLAHVLAVSGQNVTLLAVLAWPLLAWAGLGRRARLTGVLLLIALYVPLTGAGPSIVRAGVMGAAGTVAGLAGRARSRWYSLLLAAAVTLALDPRAWQDVGWQLSFAAVVGIFALMRPLEEALGRLPIRLPEALASGAAMTLAATAATAPLMSLHFGRVSIVSVLANLVALPAVAPVMWIGMLAAAAAQLSLVPAALLDALNGYLLAYVAAVAHASARVPGAVWGVRLGSPAAAVAYALPAAIALAPRRGRRHARGKARATRRVPIAAPLLAAAGVLALAVAIVHAREPGAPERFTATFLDVGQGDAALFQAPGAAALVDGGPPEAGVSGQLRSHGVHALDLVVLTHAQRDHEGGLADVLRRFPVAVLLDGGAGSPDPSHRRIVADARARGTRVVRGWAGERVRLGRLELRVLSPAREAALHPDPDEDPNLRALVLLVSYGALDFLMTADAESDVTASLRLPPVEVLKVAHHGSADEGIAALLERLRPQAAVIEVGAGNPYGHPSPATVAALGRAVPHVFRTDRDGEVTVTAAPDGRGVRARARGSPGP